MQGRPTSTEAEDAVFAEGPGGLVHVAGPVSPSRGVLDWFSFERKLSGTARLVLGFVAGALFALLPVYYYYMGRDAALRTLPGAARESVAAREPQRSSSRAGDEPGAPNRFAARMTYELTHLPEEPPPVARQNPPSASVAAAAARVPAPEAVPAPPIQAAPVPAAALQPPVPVAVPANAYPEVATLPGPRVANARPIRTEPPDPRDTTREIQKETLKPLETRAVIAGGAPVVASTAITSEPEKIQRAESQKIQRAAPDAASTPITASRVSAPAPRRVEPVASDTAPAVPAVTRGDIVEGRLAATREWLAAAPQTTHTIQIMGTNSDAHLRNHLKVLAKILEPNKIFVFRTVAQGKPAVTVVYGAYADRKGALQALEKLPPVITANRPVLRTVNGIRTEMKQHGTS